MDSLLRWGQEAVLVLWKIYMVHCQRIEDSLLEQLPDAQILTETERRFLSRMESELAELGANAIQETAEAAATGSTGEGEVLPATE